MKNNLSLTVVSGLMLLLMGCGTSATHKANDSTINRGLVQQQKSLKQNKIQTAKKSANSAPDNFDVEPDFVDNYDTGNYFADDSTNIPAPKEATVAQE